MVGFKDDLLQLNRSCFTSCFAADKELQPRAATSRGRLRLLLLLLFVCGSCKQTNTHVFLSLSASCQRVFVRTCVRTWFCPQVRSVGAAVFLQLWVLSALLPWRRDSKHTGAAFRARRVLGRLGSGRSRSGGSVPRGARTGPLWTGLHRTRTSTHQSKNVLICENKSLN